MAGEHDEPRDHGARDDEARSSNAARGTEIPMAAARRRFGGSLVWLVPLAALGVCAYLGYQAYARSGPTIYVTFKTAEGLKVEQTQVKFKAVTLGTVQGIELSDDQKYITAQLSMNARAAPLLTPQTRFWVVRPRIQAGALAALQTSFETLVSGTYIELDPSPAKGGPKQTRFKGLEQPPARRSGDPGTTFQLIADGLGPVGTGSPILHHQAVVGEVLGFELDERTGTARIRAFVRAPLDRAVNAHTCFWNASGLDVSIGAGGLHLEVASMRAMLSGGIAFQTPSEYRDEPPAELNQSFRLFDDESTAEIALYGETVSYVAYFASSLEGLARGSSVRFFGLQVGNVTDTSIVVDPATRDGSLVARVGFVLQPRRALSEREATMLYPDAMRGQVARGLHVVLETSNYLTGQKALSLQYLPHTRGTSPRAEPGAFVLPSHASGMGTVTDTLGEIAARLNGIPYEQIGTSVRSTMQTVEHAVGNAKLEHAMTELADTLEEVHALAREARGGLAPALARLPQIAGHVDEAVINANAALSNLGSENGDFQRKAERLLTQVADMARSVRLLAEFLERHPEALLRGRKPVHSP